MQSGAPDMPETSGVPGDAVTLRAENARLQMLEDKDAQIAALKTQNAGLAGRVARLERLISRNSGDSSMPPSTDDLPGKKPPERRPRRGGRRRPGKSRERPWPGGSTRTRPRTCSRRAAARAPLTWPAPADLGVRYSRQVIDLPEAPAQTTQYDRHQVRCACGLGAPRGRLLTRPARG
jgi:transposase